MDGRTHPTAILIHHLSSSSPSISSAESSDGYGMVWYRTIQGPYLDVIVCFGVVDRTIISHSASKTKGSTVASNGSTV